MHIERKVECLYLHKRSAKPDCQKSGKAGEWKNFADCKFIVSIPEPVASPLSQKQFVASSRVFFSRDFPSKLSQKLLLPRRGFFSRRPPKVSAVCLQTAGPRVKVVPRTQRHEDVRWQQSSICRAPHLSEGPALHRFCLLLCLLQDRVVETEGSRLPAAGTRWVQLLLRQSFFCTCHWHQDRLESERGNRRLLQTRCPSGPSTGGSNLTLRRPTIHHRRSNLPRQQLQICWAGSSPLLIDRMITSHTRDYHDAIIKYSQRRREPLFKGRSMSPPPPAPRPVHSFRHLSFLGQSLFGF